MIIHQSQKGIYSLESSSLSETSSTSSNITLQPKQRLISLDAFRGLIMILMAIDHANYFVARMHPTGEFWGIPLPQYESVLAFLTRWVTHICAPGFFFLMGASMILFAQSRRKKGWTEKEITRHFVIRGLLLILLQFFVENPGWSLGPVERVAPPGGDSQVWFHFGVLYGLGLSMVIWAFLLRIHSGIISGISLSAILLTQLLTPGPDKTGHLFSPLLRILFIPGKTGSVQVFYSVLSWLGLVGFGIVFGRWVMRRPFSAYRRAFFSGIVLLILFFVIRIPGGFGNFHPLQSQAWTDLLNVTKYPPSLSFLTLTLGVSLIILFLFSRIEAVLDRRGNPLVVFGRTALFFYIIHFFTYCLLGLIFAGRGGTGIPLMYPFWLAGLFLLYPLCL